jgi:hypothetical protein
MIKSTSGEGHLIANVPSVAYQKTLIISYFNASWPNSFGVGLFDVQGELEPPLETGSVLYLGWFLTP